MTILLLTGDSDPHLPKMGRTHFFAVDRPALRTEEKDNIKHLRLSGERGYNINWGYRTLTDEQVVNLLQLYHGQRVCLFSEFEEYFLQDALLSSTKVKENSITLDFIVDERTVRNDAFFMVGPADQISDLLEQLDEKINELRSVIEQADTI